MNKRDTRYALDRLINFRNTAEGPTLPPQISRGTRVPFISSLEILKKETTPTGSTRFYLTFLEPLSLQVSKYNVFYSIRGKNNQFSGPFSAQNSPIIVDINLPTNTFITFFVQTELPSGMKSVLQDSPTISSNTI
jgi:hypothetical protein